MTFGAGLTVSVKIYNIEMGKMATLFKMDKWTHFYITCV